MYLQHNPIGVKGATAFAEMLFINKSLKVLDLRNDSIGEEGTQKLIDSLRHNTRVKELWLPVKYKSYNIRVGRRVKFRRQVANAAVVDIPSTPACLVLIC